MSTGKNVFFRCQFMKININWILFYNLSFRFLGFSPLLISTCNVTNSTPEGDIRIIYLNQTLDLDAFLNPIALLLCYYVLVISSDFILNTKVNRIFSNLHAFFALITNTHIPKLPKQKSLPINRFTSVIGDMRALVFTKWLKSMSSDLIPFNSHFRRKKWSNVKLWWFSFIHFSSICFFSLTFCRLNFVFMLFTDQ